MSSETNLQLIQKIYENFGKGNIAGVLDELSDDIIWVDPGYVGNLYKGKRTGKAEVGNFFSVLNETLNITQFDIHGLTPNGNRVFVTGTIKGKARNTGK